MVRKILCALAVLALSLGVATADQLKGKITKVEDNKITFQVRNADKTFGDAKTYDLAADCKVCKMAGKDAPKEPVAAGLKAEQLQNINAEKGVRATIDVNDGKVTEIILGGKKSQ